MSTTWWSASNRSAPPLADATKFPALRQKEIDSAAAIVSMTRPCRAVGDLYLMCVATTTTAMEQCRSFQTQFANCTQQHHNDSQTYMQQRLVPLIPECVDHADPTLCAAQIMTQELMRQAHEPPRGSPN